MTRRFLLPILAVIGLISAANAQNAQREATRPAIAEQTPPVKYQLAIPPELQKNMDGIRTALEIANRKGGSPEEKREANEAWRAQLSMANSARQMFVVGIIETMVTFFGVLLVLGTLIYTRKAVDAARDAVIEAEKSTKATREIGEAQVRAYLHIKSTKVNFFKGMNEPSFEATVVNTGQSPARDVVCGVQFRYRIPQPVGNQLPPGWQNALGKAVPANGEEVISIDAQPITTNAEFDAKSHEDDTGALMSVRIVVAYRDVFSKMWEGEAYFVGFVTRTDPNELHGLFQSRWKGELSPVGRPQNWATEEF